MDAPHQGPRPHRHDADGGEVMVTAMVQHGFTPSINQCEPNAFDRTESFSSVLDMRLTRANMESSVIKCTHGYFRIFLSFSTV